MISAWWLLLIVPVSAFIGVVMMALCVINDLGHKDK